MGTLVQAIAALQDLTGALTGVREAPDYPPGAIGVTPVFIAVPGSGEYTGLNQTLAKNRHVIALQLWVSRNDLARDVKELAPYIDTVSNMLLKNVTLTNTVETIVMPITYSVGPRESGGIQYLVCEWQITVKQENAVT